MPDFFKGLDFSEIGFGKILVRVKYLDLEGGLFWEKRQQSSRETG
jgi:hypothetical protein